MRKFMVNTNSCVKKVEIFQRIQDTDTFPANTILKNRS